MISSISIPKVNHIISASCGAFSTSSGSYVDITNLSVSITTQGRPIVVMIISDQSANDAYFKNTIGGALCQGAVQILRGATRISGEKIKLNVGGATSLDVEVPSSGISTIDFPSVGTYTYKAQAKAFAGTIWVGYAKLVAWEIN